MTALDGDRLIDAADRIEQATNDLAAAVGTLLDELALARKAAWVEGGDRAVEDVNLVAEPTKALGEVVRFLAGAGLVPLLQAARTVRITEHPQDHVTDLAARWRARLATAALTSGRHRRPEGAPFAPLSGQRLVSGSSPGRAS